jgi:hypothetical protein
VRRDQLAAMQRVASELATRSLSALRILADQWPGPWPKRRFIGEPIGVWLLGLVWLILSVLALTLFT